MQNSSLCHWLQKLETTPHFLSIPAPERIKTMLQRLNLKKEFFTITIAGTNGKGTTTHLLSNYFQKQGLKVGRFTSPHLLKFNERIAINDTLASDTEIIAAFDKIEQAQEELTLTYFDYSFLASLLIFKKHQIELACLEVGLGGRLDATNAIDTDFAIITTLHLDHQIQLGEGREAIGLEKAHIMRPHIPCVCGDLYTPASIIDYAKKLKAPLYLREKDFNILLEQATWCLQTPENSSEPLAYPTHIPLQNAATALMSLILLSPKLKLTLNHDTFNQLLKTLKVPGRMQILQTQPEILIDVAHNQESAHYLAEQVKKQKPAGKTYALFSALADKDLKAIVEPFADWIDTWYIFELSTPRAATLTQLKMTILGHNPHAVIKEISKPREAWQQLLTTLQTQDCLIIFGSFLTVQLAHMLFHAKK